MSAGWRSYQSVNLSFQLRLPKAPPRFFASAQDVWFSCECGLRPVFLGMERPPLRRNHVWINPRCITSTSSAHVITHHVEHFLPPLVALTNASQSNTRHWNSACAFVSPVQLGLTGPGVRTFSCVPHSFPQKLTHFAGTSSIFVSAYCSQLRLVSLLSETTSQTRAITNTETKAPPIMATIKRQLSK